MEQQLDRTVIAGFENDAQSIGALHGSAKGSRNVAGRIRAMQQLVPLRGQRLLDIGCATGEYTIEMAPGFDEVDGIDIEPERLEIFEKRRPANVRVSAMSALDLKFPDETFDVITMVEVLEHLAEPAAALREAGRTLRPGGSLVLTTPNRRWPIEQHGILVRGRRMSGVRAPGLVWVKPLHRRFSDANAFSQRNLARLAKSAGLRLDDVTYMMPPLDSLPPGSRAHATLDWLESSALASFGQTIIASMKR